MIFINSDSRRNYLYTLAESYQDNSEIYDCTLKNTHSTPMIDTNRRGEVSDLIN